jgi:hypothetical protein
MNQRKQTSLIAPFILLILGLIILNTGCASNQYMLDEPVSDPIMTCDDQQDSDLVKLEEGGGGAAGGGCPT